MIRRGGTIEGKTYVVRDLTPEEVELGEHVKLTANTYVGKEKPSSIYM